MLYVLLYQQGGDAEHGGDDERRNDGDDFQASEHQRRPSPDNPLHTGGSTSLI